MGSDATSQETFAVCVGSRNCGHNTPAEKAAAVRGDLLEALRSRLARTHRSWHRKTDRAVIPSGCAPLDALLPGGGFLQGTLVEWLTPGHGAGIWWLVFRTARNAAQEGGMIVVLDRAKQFYPPAAVHLGVPPDRLLIVRPANETEELWALDQVLRSPAAASAIAQPKRLDPHTYRRLQLAAEQGGGLGLLIRSAQAHSECSWDEVRLFVEPLAGEAIDNSSHPCGWLSCERLVPVRRLRISVLRCRGIFDPHRFVEVEIDDALDSVRVPAQLADPTSSGRAAGA